MNIRCLIVDDEPLALDVLETYINRLQNFELIGKCQNAIEAYNMLQAYQADLIFLDIQMPKLTGIEFLKSVPNPPQVIFTTAYRDYAVEGYELNAIDYLLKPISFERFLKAIGKVTKNMPPPQQEVVQGKRAQTETEAIIPQKNIALTHAQEPFIYLKADKKMVKILLKDILYIESLKDYVRVKTLGKEVVAYQKISYLEEKLPEDRFLRIHRSFIIARDKVEAFSASHVEVSGQEITIGRNYKTEVLKKLNENNLLDE